MSIAWTEWVDDWLKNVYEPHFAPHGIEKGAALLTFQIESLVQTLRKLPTHQADAIKRVARELDNDDGPWRGPE